MSVSRRSYWRYNLMCENPSGEKLPAPLGYVSSVAISTLESETSGSQAIKLKSEMLQRRALDVALAPGKNIFMQGFMMYMSGSSINIFSIMITGMAFLNPIKAIFNINETFKRFKDNSAVDLTLPKLAFIACNLGMIALALWKCNTMGLLPITAADWTSFLVTKDVAETSAVPILIN
mmetsp:Transcript_21697/g.28080  ORF Transcript_21697/g.28080 Transcript_21697/m.28080 type:complete len:177 (-) Transcript_21697:1074-1604(-)